MHVVMDKEFKGNLSKLTPYQITVVAEILAETIREVEEKIKKEHTEINNKINL